MSRPACGALVVAVLLALVASAVPATTVDWRNAGSHVGERISVEGDVAAARVESNTCVLEFDADDADALRVRLLLPMVSSLPPRPERLYLGKRVVVTGTVRRFLGKLEMVVNSPGAIEVMGVAGGPETPPVARTAPEAPKDTSARSAPERDGWAPLIATPPPAAPAPDRAASKTPERAAAATDDAAPDRAAPAREPYPDEPPAQPPPETARVPPPTALEAEPSTAEREAADAAAPAPERAPAPTEEPPAIPDEPTAHERAPAPVEEAPARQPPAAAEPPDTPPPAPEPAAPAAAPLIAAVDPCRRARDHWSAASDTLRERMDTLSRCLDAESYACRSSAAALAPALTDLEWAEQRVEAACPR